jgi:hypothetical protein
MRRLLLLGLILLTAAAASAQSDTNDLPVVFHYLCRGGFLGRQDQVTVFADDSYRFSRRGLAEPRRGRLPDDLRRRLGDLCNRYGVLEWRQTPAPYVADGLTTELILRGHGSVAIAEEERQKVQAFGEQMIMTLSAPP